MKEKGQTPRVREVYDAFSVPEAFDAQRDLFEQSLLHSLYMKDVKTAEDALEAMRHWTVDLLDAEHPPSRHLLRMIAGELKTLYWPDQGSHDKQRRRDNERAWLISVDAQIKHLAATKYRDCEGDNAVTRAEADVAEMHGYSSSEGLQKMRERYQEHRKRADAALWRRRKRYPTIKR